jgi:glycosyltransferase involved in cell wall biosynthesis
VQLVQVPTRYPPAPGGVERHVREIAHRLAQRRHRVSVLTTDLYREIPWERLPPSVARSITEDGVRVQRLRAFSFPGELHYPFFRGLGRALKGEKPEIVHVHTYGTNQVAVTRRFARSAHVPWVLTAHYHPIWSIWGGSLRHRLRLFYDARLAAPLVREASCLIVQSREEERLLKENGFPLPRVALIPPGYSPMRAPDPGTTFARTFGIPGPFVLFVGRLASNKGLLPLLEGFRPLSQHDPTVTLVVIGADGGMRAAIERRIGELGLGSRVRLVGYVEDERLVSAAFQEARVFVLPSEYEAFGLVLLEALAHGTPVIASRVGGIPEFIEDGKAGRLIPPEDAAAVTSALLEIWSDPDLGERWGRYGREITVPKYTWDRVVDQLETVYREVVGT